MWNEVNVAQCLAFCGRRPERILVVGCGNKGEDIKAFNKLLVPPVIIHGADIVEDVGRDYPAENVMYVRADATDLPMMSEYYDLAYSFATFEHIRDISSAWQNMLRVLRKGGILCTVAAPLWMSPYGHHKRDIFDGYPYAHLQYPTPEELLEFCRIQGLREHEGIDIVHHVNYMLSDNYFNKHDSQYYLDSASALQGCTLLTNSLDRLSDGEAAGHQALVNMGFPEQDLLSVTHRLVAVKS